MVTELSFLAFTFTKQTTLYKVLCIFLRPFMKTNDQNTIGTPQPHTSVNHKKLYKVTLNMAYCLASPAWAAEVFL